MTPRVVYDTNVVVSATLKAGSIPASLVILALDRHVRLCLSPIIFAEYEAVLKRPKFAFDAHAVDAFLRDLRRVAIMVFPAKHVHVASHEPDNRFLECAQAARAQYLVTGNKRHFPFSVFGKTRVVSPSEFARIVTKQP
jgi:putative PIN family toxin of toxin-antitoxin system